MNFPKTFTLPFAYSTLRSLNRIFLILAMACSRLDMATPVLNGRTLQFVPNDTRLV